MKKILFSVICLVSLFPSLAFAQLTTYQGGTGLVGISVGSIPFGSSVNLRLGTSSALQFNNSASRLTVTYASTTALSSGAFAVSGSGTSTFGGGIDLSTGCFAVSGVCLSSSAGTVTSIATTYPVTGGTITTTGTIGLDFGTTTSNTWASTQAFGAITVVNSTTSSSLASTGSTTLANFAFSNSIGLQATTTALFAQYASTTSLFANNATSTFFGITRALTVGTTSPWSSVTLGQATLASSSITVGENALATSTSMTIDFRTANTQLVRIGVSATTIGFTGYIAGSQVKVLVCNPPSASAGAITWSGVLWAGGTAPTQTTTAAKCDVWSFIATAATSTANALKIFGAQSASF